MTTDYFSGAYSGSIANPQNLLSLPEGVGGSAPRQWCVSIDVSAVDASTIENHLPRMRIIWGRGRAQREVVADLQSCRFSIEASNITVTLFQEQDNLALPWNPDGIVTASAVAVPGCISPQLTYLTRSRGYNTGGGAGTVVPYWAHKVELVQGRISPPFGEAVPLQSYLYIYSLGIDPAGANYQSFDMANLIHNPTPVHGAGGFRSWNFMTQGGADTSLFRLRWYLGM